MVRMVALQIKCRRRNNCNCNVTRYTIIVTSLPTNYNVFASAVLAAGFKTKRETAAPSEILSGYFQITFLYKIIITSSTT